MNVDARNAGMVFPAKTTPPLPPAGTSRPEHDLSGAAAPGHHARAGRAGVEEPRPAPDADPGSANEIHAAIEKLNRRLEARPLEARYSVDEATRRVVVKIVNRDSGETLCQIPSEEALRLAAVLTENTGRAAPAPGWPRDTAALLRLVDETA